GRGRCSPSPRRSRPRRPPPSRRSTPRRCPPQCGRAPDRPRSTLAQAFVHSDHTPRHRPSPSMAATPGGGCWRPRQRRSIILWPMRIRVILAADNYLLREGLSQLLESSDEIELVCSCADLPELERSVGELNPDVVITDIRMPPTGTDEGIRAADRLRSVRPQVGVVVLSHYAEPEYALALLERGAAGRAYLLKERVSDLGQLVSAVRDVARGGSVIDPGVVEVLVAAKKAARDSPLTELTPRESEVLAQMAQGKNNAG